MAFQSRIISNGFLLFGVVFTSFFAARVSYAVPPTCDPDFYDVMKARIWMEGKREMETAQTLILKPDSVLEYSCFNDQVEALGDVGGDMFSSNVDSSDLFNDPPEEFKPSGSYASDLSEISTDDVTAPIFDNQDPLRVGPNPPGGALSSARLGNVLGLLVVDTEFQYNVDNFGHPYAGGFFAGSAGGSACNPMDIVWEFSKCSNFRKINFREFSELGAADPRVVPLYTALNCDDTSRAGNWSAAISAAAPLAGNAGGVDAVVTRIDMLDAAACSSVAPIPTGVKVYRGASESDDAVCSAPGCYYDGSGSCN